MIPFGHSVTLNMEEGNNSQYTERAVYNKRTKRLRPSFPLKYYNEELCIHNNHSLDLSNKMVCLDELTSESRSLAHLIDNKAEVEKCLKRVARSFSEESGHGTFTFFSPTILVGAYHSVEYQQTILLSSGSLNYLL